MVPGPFPIDQVWSEPRAKLGVYRFLKSGSLSNLGSKIEFWVLKWKEHSCDGGLVKLFCRKLDGLSFSKKFFVKKLFRSRVTAEKRDSGGEMSVWLWCSCLVHVLMLIKWKLIWTVYIIIVAHEMGYNIGAKFFQKNRSRKKLWPKNCLNKWFLENFRVVFWCG